MRTIEVAAVGGRFYQKAAIADLLYVSAKTVERDIALLSARGAPGFASLSHTQVELERCHVYWIVYLRLLRDWRLRGKELDNRLYESIIDVNAETTTIEGLILERNGKQYLKALGL